MQVRAIQYGSPGLKDLAGIGEVIGHIKDILFRIIDHYSERKKRKIKEQKMELENRKLFLENTKTLIDLVRANGYSEAEVKDSLEKILTPKQEFFARLASEQKLVSVELLPIRTEDRE